MKTLALGWLILTLMIAESRASWETARAAEQQGDWSAALLDYENLYDSTPTDDAARAELRKKFAELRPRVPANTDPAKAGVWKVQARVYRELDFSWKDKQGKDHHAQYRYREDEIERLRRGMKGFAEKVWELSRGGVRIDWDLKVIESPLKQLDWDVDSYWPGPVSCMPGLTNIAQGQADTIMVFAKISGDRTKGETGERMPIALFGATLGADDPATKGATYVGFNWGAGAAAKEPDGEPMVHEWLHATQWCLEDYQHYPRGLFTTSDGGRVEGETGGDPCFRRKPSENTWLGFYAHILREHATRKMLRELTVRGKPDNVWLKREN